VAYGIAVDGSGNAYVTGRAESSDFPTTPSAYDTSFDGGAAFVTKLDPAGSALSYSTFLGGGFSATGFDIAVDASGSAFVSGEAGPDFPTTAGAYDTTHNGAEDVFVTRLNPPGSALSYSTFLGATGFDEGFGIAVDAGGSAHVTGATTSGDFPTTSDAHDRQFSGGDDGFVSRLDPTGSALLHSSYLGGGESDRGFGIAVGPARSVYVGGQTGSRDFPTTPAAYDTSFNGGSFDAFVTKLAPDVIRVTIDVKPRDAGNRINLRSRGVIPVAILTTQGFDARSVDVRTVCFGDAEQSTQRACSEAHGRGHTEDVDGDGDLDLVLHFRAQETGIDPGDTRACLTGATLDGRRVEGCDPIRPG